ncbi:nucleoside 2-deoxyribosyltransferase [Rhizobium sp. LjRoot254]|uniref:nucleoside 2-deoxyribosyltransferase n=1 Tax=Rhizobium sp. LjRoot254 TaxID=3342297 RepID=UPI003ECDC28D
MKKLYIAGPEVFLVNAREQMDRKAALVRQYGFEPLCPGDLDIPAQKTKKAFGLAISKVNEGMMNAADGVIANLTPFRGQWADVGTVFELGYMCALGKMVAAYTNVASDHYQRTLDFYDNQITEDAKGYRRGPDGLSLEDFEMTDNLMLDGGVERRGGIVAVHAAAADEMYTDLTAFEECLKFLAERRDERDEGMRPEELDASNDD